jgi:parallel beta-helix repeat protein
MTPLRDIEGDGRNSMLMLSMRTKASLLGLCFLLILGLIAYMDAPHFAQAVRGLGQGAALAENESQPPQRESPQKQETLEEEEPPEQETTSEGLASQPWWMKAGISIGADGYVYPWWGIEYVFPEGDGTYVLVDDLYLGREFEECPVCGSQMFPDGYHCPSCELVTYRVLWVEADNVVIDGAGYTIREHGSSGQLRIDGARNVTLKNLDIIRTGYNPAIRFTGTDGCLLVDSTVQYSGGRDLPSMEYRGVGLHSTNNMTLRNVEVKNFGYGILLDSCNNTLLADNTLSNCTTGLNIDHEYGCGTGSHNSVLIGNTISDNRHGIRLGGCVGTVICHNNFINNSDWDGETSHIDGADCTLWDEVTFDGNYWADYVGDQRSWDRFDGERNVVDDTPYIIIVEGQDVGQDPHPLMQPWTGVPEPALLSILGLILLPAMLRRIPAICWP